MNNPINFGDLVTTLTPQAAALVEEHQLQCQRIDQEVSAQSIAKAAVRHAMKNESEAQSQRLMDHINAELEKFVRQNPGMAGTEVSEAWREQQVASFFVIEYLRDCLGHQEAQS